MKNKFLKPIILFLSLGITFSSLPSVLAGGGLSKPVYKETKFNAEQMDIISKVGFYPHNAVDGGKKYYGAWNGSDEGNDFKIFTQNYSAVIENERPASTLGESIRGENWYTGPIYSNSFRIEDIESSYLGEYILRVDYENKIIYTIRRSGSEYLCTFYLIYVNPNDPNDVKVNVDYHLLLLSSVSRVKDLLLPIDKELLNWN